MSVWSRGCFCGGVKVSGGKGSMGEKREREKGGDEQGKKEVLHVMYASHMGQSQTEIEYYSVMYFEGIAEFDAL